MSMMPITARRKTVRLVGVLLGVLALVGAGSYSTASTAQRDPVPVTVRMVKDDTACTPQSPTGGNVPFEGRTVGKVVVTTGAPDEDGNVEVRAEVRFRLAHRRPRADVRLNLVHLGDPLVTGCTTLDHEKTKKRHSQRLTLTARVPADSVLQVSVWRGSSNIKSSELFRV